MDLDTLLIGFAQIGIVLIGFISVFLTFLLRDTTLDNVMRMHARALIMTAPLALAAAIVPLALFGFGVNETAALRWSIIILAGPGMAAAILNNYHFVKLSAPERKRTGYSHMALANVICGGMTALGIAALVTQYTAGSYIGILVLLTLASVLALFTSFIVELKLFGGKD